MGRSFRVRNQPEGYTRTRQQGRWVESVVCGRGGVRGSEVVVNCPCQDAVYLRLV